MAVRGRIGGSAGTDYPAGAEGREKEELGPNTSGTGTGTGTGIVATKDSDDTSSSTAATGDTSNTTCATVSNACGSENGEQAEVGGALNLENDLASPLVSSSSDPVAPPCSPV